MQSLKLKNIFLLLALSANAYAAEEEGGAKPAVEENKEQKEFSEKSAKLTALTSKIEEADKKFEELVKEKAEAKSPSEKQRLIKELTETDNERGKAKADYDKIKSEIALRFPNQGINSKRNYQTEGGAKAKDEKGAATLDELLTRTKKIIDKKFAAFADEKKREGEIKKDEKTESEKKLRLEK